MKFIKLPVVLFILAIVLLVGILWLAIVRPVAPYRDPQLPDKLKTAEAKWQSQKLTDYKIVLQYRLGMIAYTPVTYTVRAGKIIEATPVYSEVVQQFKVFEQTESVAGLFTLAKSELKKNRADNSNWEVRIDFDERGYPKFIYGNTPNVFDGQQVWDVKSFEILSP